MTADNPILNPEEFIQWKKSMGQVKMTVVPRRVIFIPESLHSRRIKWSGSSLKGVGACLTCTSKETGTYVASKWGVGAPALLSVSELLRGLGATHFVLLGFAGHLNSPSSPNRVYYASSAHSEVGTSFHYAPEGELLFQPTTDLVKLATEELSLKGAKLISTDAPFRETLSKYTHWKSLGAEMIDMEIAALYSFAAFYQLSAIGIVAGADYITPSGWRPPESLAQSVSNLKSILHKLLAT
ncbi:MAG: hypothetical protein RIC30_15290 [Marinoscillum sp.]|uniref:phosphorylase family protein n=1 Tax=Marinoscillum sp. TaxID=2024838 RepID=UPI0032FE0B4C